MYPLSVYAFFGFENNKATKLFENDTYKASDDATINGVNENVRKGRMLMNDMLFTCAARKVVQNQSQNQQPVTMYHFDYAPSFNFWPMAGGLFDKLSSLSCLNADLENGVSGKACHAAELPFVFNKPMDIASQKVYTTKEDRELMNLMSRKWFSTETFENKEMLPGMDNAVMIDSRGFNSVDGWDASVNDGRCELVKDLLL